MSKLTAPVVFPRPQALKIAKYERDSLRARARTSIECAPLWNAAANQAGLVVSHLESGKDRKAARAALKVGPAWKRAADCEGWPTPPLANGPAGPGEVNFQLFDRYTVAHFSVGVMMGVMRLKWWQALAFSVAWELVETPLKRRFPEVFPYSSEDSFANAFGDTLGFMAGWGSWKLIEQGAKRS